MDSDGPLTVALCAHLLRPPRVSDAEFAYVRWPQTLQLQWNAAAALAVTPTDFRVEFKLQGPMRGRPYPVPFFFATGEWQCTWLGPVSQVLAVAQAVSDHNWRDLRVKVVRRGASASASASANANARLLAWWDRDRDGLPAARGARPEHRGGCERRPGMDRGRPRAGRGLPRPVSMGLHCTILVLD